MAAPGTPPLRPRTPLPTKLRWDLAADENERQDLLGLAEGGPTIAVVHEPAQRQPYGLQPP
ncbi:hypothetical protein [Streptomyces lavendulae]|uniref:hypothetical protein n=1 Tax=Streptomyces lavendulae TaxID=1914 RepID=UPI00368E49E1